MLDLRRALDLDVPIVQAPMAGVQDHRLAAAASQAGALGSLPCALLDAAGIGRELSALKAAAGDRAINANFFCHLSPEPDAERAAAWLAALEPYYRELGLDPTQAAVGPTRQPFDAAAAGMVETCRPAVVSFQFGLPDPASMARVRAAGALVFSTATTVAEALWLEARGVDAIVAQGLEAGGHRGHFLSDDLSLQLGTFALVPQIVRAVRVPVIAAGGIVDRRGVTAALALGASLVQVGSAFLLCPEATTSDVHRRALAGPEAVHTRLTRLFSGRPARGIVNRLMRELEQTALLPAFPLATSALQPLRKAAEARGSGDFSPLWCGQNPSGCRPVPAAEIVDGLGRP